TRDRAEQCGRGKQTAREDSHDQYEWIEWRDVPAPDAHRAPAHLIERHSGTESGADDSAHRGRDDVAGNELCLLERPEGSCVSEGFGAAARQDENDPTHLAPDRSDVPS